MCLKLVAKIDRPTFNVYFSGGHFSVCDDVRLSSMKKIVIFVVGVLLIVWVGVQLGWHEGAQEHVTEEKRAPQKKVLSNQDIALVSPHRVAMSLNLNGSLNTLRKANIPTQVEGIVEGVFVRVGDRVQKDQVLATLNPETLTLNEQEQHALLFAAKSKLILAKQRFEKHRALFEQGFISSIALAEHEADYLSQQANYEAQHTRWVNAERDVKRSQVRAPFAGIISERQLEAGQVASKYAHAFSVVDPSVLELASSVSARDVFRLKVGQVVEFKLENGKSYQGTLMRISPIANPNTRSVPIFMHIDNHDYALNIGQFIQGKLILEQRDQVLSLPATALRDRQDTRAFVLRVNAQGMVERVEIVLGLEDNETGWFEVFGLAKGDRIVLNTVSGLLAGHQVAWEDAPPVFK